MSTKKAKLKVAEKEAGARLVMVRWIDSAGASVWMMADETVDPVAAVTVGWLLEKTKKKLVVSSTVAGAKTSSEQSNAPMAIPRCSVIEWRYLTKGDAR